MAGAEDKRWRKGSSDVNWVRCEKIGGSRKSGKGKKRLGTVQRERDLDERSER